MIEAGYTKNDLSKDLTLNEFLRLFRGIFFQNHIPADNKDYTGIFNLYADSVKLLEPKLNLSTWLTVIETCRHAGEGLGGLLEYSLNKFSQEYNLDELFSTESAAGQTGGMDQYADA